MENYNDLLRSLRRVTRAIDLHSKKLYGTTGLTTPQFLVLHQIQQEDGVLAKDIAEAINLSSATVTSILDRLELRELVIRQRSTIDKRKVQLYLTDMGKQAIEQISQPLQPEFIDRFEALETCEQSAIITSVQRLATMMDADANDIESTCDPMSIFLDKKSSQRTRAKTFS